MNERFAGWKASLYRWKDAGETVWWRHGRCGQVARKDAAGRSPVHPFVPSRLLPPSAACCPIPPSHLRSPHVHTRGRALYPRNVTRITRLSLSLFFFCCCFFLFFFFSAGSPFSPLRLHLFSSPPRRDTTLRLRSRSECERAALTKLPVFVLQGIVGYCAPRVNTIIDPLHFAPRNENSFRQGGVSPPGRLSPAFYFEFLLLRHSSSQSRARECVGSLFLTIPRERH